MKVAALAIHDEHGIAVSLHRDLDDAYDALRRDLNDNPVDYQELLPSTATRDEIIDAAIDRSQFAWEIGEIEVPT